MLSVVMPRPYLSLVIPTRNDAYPSNILPVQNQCLSVLQRQLEAARIDSEIIVVEYNSDPANPHLHESLRVDCGRYVTIKVITVPPPCHQRFPHSQRRVFHQTCAVNVGLRRSRGRFFVYRAADHLYSDSLVRFLGRKTLRDDCIYRCDRFDVHPSALDSVRPDRLDQITGICEQHLVDWHQPLTVSPSYRIPALHTNACGDFLLMSREVWSQLGGLREGRFPIFLDYDSLLLYAAAALGNTQTILPSDCKVYKIDHGMKTTARLQQVWSPAARRMEGLVSRLEGLLPVTNGGTLVNWSRIVFNYPRRSDRSFPGVLLDSYERHFVLPAFLWSHKFPFVRQNYGDWGLGSEVLPEKTLVSADWETVSPHPRTLAAFPG